MRGRVAVAALGVFAMLNVAAFTFTAPAPGGGGGGLLEEDDAISIGLGAAFWISVPLVSNAFSRAVMPATSCALR